MTARSHDATERLLFTCGGLDRLLRHDDPLTATQAHRAATLARLRAALGTGDAAFLVGTTGLAAAVPEDGGQANSVSSASASATSRATSSVTHSTPRASASTDA